MLFSKISDMQSTSTVQRRIKRFVTKIAVPSPDFIKVYNQGMGGVDLVNQRTVASPLDRKSSNRFCQCMFFNLIDVACVNAFILYNMMHQNDLTLLDYKTIVSTHSIGRCTSRSRATPEQKAGRKRKHQYHFESNNLPSHLPEFQHSRKRCEYCYKEGFDRKIFVKCTDSGLLLCVVKERKCFLKHHS